MSNMYVTIFKYASLDVFSQSWLNFEVKIREEKMGGLKYQYLATFLGKQNHSLLKH